MIYARVSMEYLTCHGESDMSASTAALDRDCLSCDFRDNFDVKVFHCLLYGAKHL